MAPRSTASPRSSAAAASEPRRWGPRGTAALGLICVLATTLGCSPAGTENRPPAADARARGEDGLTVGHRLMAAGEHELALKAYLRAAAEQGIDVDVLSALGSANLALGRLGQAEQLLRRALEADPTFVPAINNLGVVLMERGRPGEARQVFQQAFALDSGRSDSIRENLRRAIAATEGTVYDGIGEDPGLSLVRRDQGEFVLLSQL